MLINDFTLIQRRVVVDTNCIVGKSKVVAASTHFQMKETKKMTSLLNLLLETKTTNDDKKNYSPP